MKTALKYNPLVSVIIAVFNGEEYIERAINSILLQTYKNIEIIIVNDGSDDNTKDILKNYKENNIVVIHNSMNIGISKSRNIGGRLAKGKYIAVQDADDVSLPQRIKMQVNFLESRPDIVLLGATQYNVNKGIRKLGRYFNEEEIKRRLLLHNPIAHTSAFFPKTVYLALNGYNENFTVSVDFELYNRLMKFGNVAMIKEPLVEYYIHTNSISYKRKLLQCINSAKVRYRNIHTIGMYIFFKATAYRCIVAYTPKIITRLVSKVRSMVWF